MEGDTMPEKKTWEEFRKSGLLWYVNMILHVFGWSIVFEIENHEVKEVYPARVAFRGFSEEFNTKGYINVTNNLKENIDELIKEANN